MTRWARSLTSKASNKKTPEEATPWHVMVASMKATQSREQNPEADDFSHENETEEEKEEDEEVDPSYSEEVDESMKSSSIPCDSTAFKEEGDIEKEEEQDTEAGNHEMPEYEKASGSHKAQERKRKHQFVTEPMPGRAKIFFEGSWVTPEVKADLLKMRKKLLADGIPKDKVSELVRKGRRREEKSYKRDKKKVCFQCREFGHYVSQCPQLENSMDTGTGICFRCGSTEHSSKSCRARLPPGSGKYPYAKCFVCKEQGHISSECPDNPRGLYPMGGSCRLCGSVTHLRRDCPRLQASKHKQRPTSGSHFSRKIDHITKPKIVKF